MPFNFSVAINYLDPELILIWDFLLGLRRNESLGFL